ncbi:MAG TPA: hypothetical protein DCQ29_01170 [Chitinophagaceae bacterium]|nr:hypothetical protein [Chitinophagaceae bacterium]
MHSFKENLKKWWWAVAIILFFIVKSGDSNSPIGKTWMSKDASIAYSFGNTYGKSDNFLNYNQIFYDHGSPVGHIHRTGIFSIDGSTINSNFSDGQPPYKLEYKKVDGEWCVVDGSGNIFVWDDPAKRE